MLGRPGIRWTQRLTVAPVACLLALVLAASARAEAAWTTYHRDATRSGVAEETGEAIAPSLDWQSVDLDAPMWNEPLVLGDHVYAATVGNEVYELNAATGAIEWQASAGTPVPSSELPCGDITPTVGIVSTPLIDTATNTIYVVADTWDAGSKEAAHYLEGFALGNGERVLDTPVDPPDTNARTILQRSALNFDEGQIVFGFGGNSGSCSRELAPIVAVPATGGEARFWQTHGPKPTTAGGMWDTAGAAVDGEGHIFAATANPIPTGTITETEYDYSDSLIELTLNDFVKAPKEEALTQVGWFKPPDWEEISNKDLDLGSAGPELLPGGIVFQAGKHGGGYLIDEATMGAGAAALYNYEVCGGALGSFGGGAYQDGTIFIPCTNGVQALSYDEAAKTFTPLWKGPANAFGSPILAAGSVWVEATGGFNGGGETLYGLDPANGETRYTVTLPSPIADHFGSPSAAGGRLFVASGSTVSAYQVTQPSKSEPTPPGEPTPPAGQKSGSTTSTPSTSTTTSGTSSTASSTGSGPTKPAIVSSPAPSRPVCRAGYTAARISGHSTCLHKGELCEARYRSQYRRYHFGCVRKGLRFRLVIIKPATRRSATEKRPGTQRPGRSP